MEREKEEFFEKIPVPRETAEKLERYAALLEEWNQKFNLVAASTIPHIWQRHFLDSAQLLKLIPDTAKSIIDIGSGAGFPALVLAILGAPPIQLIESTGKKANFLRTVIEVLKLNATVHQDRAENLKSLKADVITARAVGGLNDLLKYANPLMEKGSVCLFLKGQNAAIELTESRKYWTFDCDTIPSMSDATGTILLIRDLMWKHAGKHRRHIRKG